jgi:lipoprotein LpqH
MHRRFLVAAVGTAIVVAGLTTFSTTRSNASPSDGSGPVVLIDGQDQGVGDMKVYCHEIPGISPLGATGHLYNVAIGNTGGFQLTEANPPEVEEFGFQKQPYNLEYHKGVGSGNATVVKNGNSYKVTGTASGYQLTNTVTKSFEVDATCP